MKTTASSRIQANNPLFINILQLLNEAQYSKSFWIDPKLPSLMVNTCCIKVTFTDSQQANQIHRGNDNAFSDKLNEKRKRKAFRQIMILREILTFGILDSF